MRVLFKLSTLLTVLSAVVIFMGASLQAHAEETVSLTFASPYPLGHPSDIMAKKLMSKVEKASNGKIKFSYFPAEQLAKSGDLLSTCRSGIADICQIHVTYFSGKLPYSNTIVLPFWTTATEGAAIFQWMLENVSAVQAEYKRYGVRPLYGMTTPSYNVGTVEKPVRSLKDLAGLKLKTAGGIYDDIAERYGIIPVTIAASETYSALQHSVVDGVVFNYPSIRSYHLDDLLNYITWGMRAGGYPGVTVINLKTWNSLPRSYQNIIAKAAHEMSQVAGHYWDQHQKEAREEFESEGIEIYELTPEQKRKWGEKLNGLAKQYISEMEDRGFDKIGNVVAQYKKAAKRITSHE